MQNCDAKMEKEGKDRGESGPVWSTVPKDKRSRLEWSINLGCGKPDRFFSLNEKEIQTWKCESV